MRQSLRWTLAVRFAATMAVGLAGTLIAASWGASRVLHHQLDQSLAAVAFLIANEIATKTREPGVDPPLAADASGYRREINRYVVIRDVAGRAVGATPGSAMDLPLDGAALRAAQEGRREFSNGRWHEMPIRSVYVAVSTGGVPGDRVVHVAASLDPIRSLQRNLALIFAGIVLLGFAATFVGAWSIAGSVVRPVAEITQQAAHIEAGTLAQRISAHATTDEYRGLVAVLNRMLERLDGAFRAQRRFTGDVSHELRTPLTALRGEIEVALRSEREPREYQRVLWSALEEIERLTSMTEDLLLIARAESHLVVPQRVSSDVNAVLRSALDQMRQRIAEKRLTVETVFDAANRMAPLDAGLVTRLVRNLVDNAVKFAPVGGQLKVVSGSDDGGGVRLRIENPGPPIAPEDLPHVFEPFYRADRARSRGTGTGLGLAVAAAIARLHGGEIRAGSRNGAGVWVEVDLPAPERS